jgi:NitT/TauT family transport system substrate-binding protein
MGLTRAAALAVVASAAFTAERRPAAAQSSTIRIGAGTGDAHMEPFYAKELGLFEKAGLDVAVTTFASPATIAEAMAGGAIDVGLGDPLQLALAMLHGIPFAYFAGSTLFSATTPTLVLCANGQGAVKTPKDLEGKTIAVPTVNTFVDISIREWLKQNGADPSGVKFFEMRYSEVPAGLARGTIDAGLVGEPFLSSATESLRRLGVPFEAVGKSFYVVSWFTRRDWFASNADKVRKLAAVFYQTARWANTHHSESATIESAYLKIDAARIQAMARNTFDTSLDPAQIQPVLDLSTRYKLLPRRVAASEIMVS